MALRRRIARPSGGESDEASARKKDTQAPVPQVSADAVQRALSGAHQTGSSRSSDVISLQRVIGNRAVSELIRKDQQQRERSRAVQPLTVRRSRRAAHPQMRATSMGAATNSTQTGQTEGASARSPLLQRYKTSAGFAILGTKVNFESTALAATLAGGLQFTKTASDLDVSSKDYRANGTVKASGPKERVKEFDLGFLQTVYRSDRTFYYEPEAYDPGLGEQIGTAVAPALFSNRFKITDTLESLPVRDGDTGVVPWYEVGDISAFDEADESTKSTNIYDRPSTQFPWTQTKEGTEQHLVKTGGKDVFRTWLSAQERGTTGFMGMHRLGYVDWEVDYGASVTFNKANPASSGVAETTGGGQILGIEEGPGVKIPLMGDPVANDTTKEVEGWW